MIKPYINFIGSNFKIDGLKITTKWKLTMKMERNYVNIPGNWRMTKLALTKTGILFLYWVNQKLKNNLQHMQS